MFLINMTKRSYVSNMRRQGTSHQKMGLWPWPPSGDGPLPSWLLVLVTWPDICPFCLGLLCFYPQLTSPGEAPPSAPWTSPWAPLPDAPSSRCPSGSKSGVRHTDLSLGCPAGLPLPAQTFLLTPSSTEPRDGWPTSWLDLAFTMGLILPLPPAGPHSLLCWPPACCLRHAV